MSLLLDALKKAAEQKAEKSKQEIPQASPTDETVIEVAAEDISKLEKGAEGIQQAARALQDETELDNSELDTRLESTRVDREDGDETQLQIPDPTETQAQALSAQMQTGEDETIIFTEEDVSEFLDESEPVGRESRAPGDETDLSQLTRADDDTDLSQVEARDYARDRDVDATRADDTDISQPFQPGDPTDFKAQAGTEDETDISVPVTTADQIEPAEPQQARPGEDTDLSRVSEQSEDTDVNDDDMSLLLVEREETNLTAPTSVTDPRSPRDDITSLEADAGVDEGLALVDTTRHQLPDENTATVTQSNTTATTGVALDTQTTQGATTRTETTSTHTYAPDNYDRTLMRLPSDDASKLFAGMKSDSDVVMTPDYAKKVFRSKSSAQRIQHYKFYTGIVVVILLGIGIYGSFEFQDESDIIDTSLRPLKRDPMPGIIQSGGNEQTTILFPESGETAGVDARTIELIESAEQNRTEGELSAVTEEASAEASTATISSSETVSPTEADAAAEAIEQPAVSGTIAETQSEATSVASITQTESTSVDTSASAALSISSSSRIEEKHIWLREAYAAYESGNDDLAMTRYNQVLEVDPTNRNALLARAAINVQNNNSRAAISDYQKLLLANPKDSLAMTSLITVANYSPRETESQLKLMIRDEPDSPYLNFALANAYGAQNRWQEAQGHYYRALENNPGDPNYAYNLAVSLEHISQPRAAVPYYRRALDNFESGLATFDRELVDQRLEMLGKL